MIRKFIRTKLIHSFIVFSMVTTSFGGAFAIPAYADSPEDTVSEDSVKGSPSTNSILVGVAAIGLITALGNHGDSTNSASGSTSGKAYTSSAEEAQALSLLNQDRTANGLAALKANSQLTKLAENYALDMINRGYFSHYNPEGQSPFDRMKKAGITYKTAGENLGINTSVSAAEKAFMNSSGHRANILNSAYTEVGIGVVHSPDGSIYVVQEFIGK
ncbi:MAG: uncharacterized protein K0R55_3512 [Sporomusa sp.]|nr:uncharacterized protein [Sporomusa sp.]